MIASDANADDLGDSYDDHTERLAGAVRAAIREGHAKTRDDIPEVIGWCISESPWLPIWGRARIVDDVTELLEELVLDDDEFDLECARGGFEIELAELIEWYCEDPNVWGCLPELVWVWFEESEEQWHGAELDGLTLAPESDYDAMELYRRARELAPNRI